MLKTTQQYKKAFLQAKDNKRLSKAYLKWSLVLKGLVYIVTYFSTTEKGIGQNWNKVGDLFHIIRTRKNDPLLSGHPIFIEPVMYN